MRFITPILKVFSIFFCKKHKSLRVGHLKIKYNAFIFFKLHDLFLRQAKSVRIRKIATQRIKMIGLLERIIQAKMK